VAVSLIIKPVFLYRCAGLLYKLAERVEKQQIQLTPEVIMKEAPNFTAEEMRSLGEVLKLLSLMMQALLVTRDSTIDQLTRRIFELEQEKERGWQVNNVEKV
jgi:hypothetical protein